MTDDLVKRLRDNELSFRISDTVERWDRERNEAADRIERLEAALREIDRTSDSFTSMSYAMFTQAVRNIARKALEGKDESN
jgi:hypothetical protein